MSDILAIAILSTICGAEHFTEMEEFGHCEKSLAPELSEAEEERLRQRMDTWNLPTPFGSDGTA